jgi:SAM-dependent methyltransferase
VSIFQQYAELYDTCYQDKDYANEAQFVLNLISRHTPMAQTVVDLGCGTGRHAAEFAKGGFNVFGVDKSLQMIANAKANADLLPADVAARLDFEQADVTSFACSGLRDVAVSLFHVINYHTGNEELVGAFRSARNSLKPNGLFIFDFWYGPAVLTDRPGVRIKRIEADERRLIRLAEPTMDLSRNGVDVNYTFLVTDTQSGQLIELKETHSLRFLFLPEIELIASLTGFQIVETGEWLSSRPLHEASWSGYVVARANC